MADTFKDVNAAARTKAAVVKLIKSTIQEVRPKYRYATVTSIDSPNNICTVTYPGEGTNVTVKMHPGATPSSVGQVVRVDGLKTDRFVAEVLGTPQAVGGSSGSSPTFPQVVLTDLSPTDAAHNDALIDAAIASFDYRQGTIYAPAGGRVSGTGDSGDFQVWPIAAYHDFQNCDLLGAGSYVYDESSIDEGYPATIFLCTTPESAFDFTGAGYITGGFNIDGGKIAITPFRRFEAFSIFAGDNGRVFQNIVVGESGHNPTAGTGFGIITGFTGSPSVTMVATVINSAGSQSTDPFLLSATSAAGLQSLLEALSNVGVGKVTVTSPTDMGAPYFYGFDQNDTDVASSRIETFVDGLTGADHNCTVDDLKFIHNTAVGLMYVSGYLDTYINIGLGDAYGGHGLVISESTSLVFQNCNTLGALGYGVSLLNETSDIKFIGGELDAGILSTIYGASTSRRCSFDGTTLYSITSGMSVINLDDTAFNSWEFKDLLINTGNANALFYIGDGVEATLSGYIDAGFRPGQFAILGSKFTTFENKAFFTGDRVPDPATDYKYSDGTLPVSAGQIAAQFQTGLDVQAGLGFKQAYVLYLSTGSLDAALNDSKIEAAIKFFEGRPGMIYAQAGPKMEGSGDFTSFDNQSYGSYPIAANHDFENCDLVGDGPFGIAGGTEGDEYASTTFLCTTPEAGFTFGGIGNVTGGFHLNGGGIATTPFFRNDHGGFDSGRTFQNIYVSDSGTSPTVGTQFGYIVTSFVSSPTHMTLTVTNDDGTESTDPITLSSAAAADIQAALEALANVGTGNVLIRCTETSDTPLTGGSYYFEFTGTRITSVLSVDQTLGSFPRIIGGNHNAMVHIQEGYLDTYIGFSMGEAAEHGMWLERGSAITFIGLSTDDSIGHTLVLDGCANVKFINTELEFAGLSPVKIIGGADFGLNSFDGLWVPSGAAGRSSPTIDLSETDTCAYEFSNLQIDRTQPGPIFVTGTANVTLTGSCSWNATGSDPGKFATITNATDILDNKALVIPGLDPDVDFVYLGGSEHSQVAAQFQTNVAVVTPDGVRHLLYPGTGGGATVVTNEALTGTKDGSNMVFTTANPYITGTTAVYMNGIRQSAPDNYTETGPSELTMSFAPESSDSFIVDYTHL